MARLLSQIQGRRALKQVLNIPSPIVSNLNKFNVEPFRVSTYELGAQSVYHEAGMSKLTNLYHSTFLPFFTGEILQEYVPRMGLNLAYINSVAKKHVWKVSLVTTACKGMLADIVAQKVFEKKEQLDYKRTGLFFMFGAVYSGCICHGLWTKVYPMVFTSRFTSLNALGAILFDNLVNTPFIFFPIFYAMKECLFSASGNLTTALKKWQKEAFEASTASWKLWFPAHVITFGLMPVHLRIPFGSIVSFFYFMMVSLQQTTFEARREQDALLEENFL